jgi:hypothetical protein
VVITVSVVCLRQVLEAVDLLSALVEGGLCARSAVFVVCVLEVEANEHEVGALSLAFLNLELGSDYIDFTPATYCDS